MATTNLAPFIALNDQFVALVKADVPVHLGLPRRCSDAIAALDRIIALVTRRVGEGTSLDEALEDQAIPAAYRSVAQLALKSGNFATSIEDAGHIAQSQDDSWHALRMSMRYPLVICCLAYVGIVLFCVFLVPTLESMYQSMRIATGWGLAAVMTLRRTLPFWVAIPPIGLVLLVALTRWTSARPARSGRTVRLLPWLPGMAKVVGEQRSARFATSLAGFLDAEAPLHESLRMAAAAWENEAFEQGTLALSASLERGQFPSDDTPFALALPPLLRWAIWHPDDTVGRSRALRMAADVYRESAQRRVQRLRVTAPIVTCVVIGGGVVLLYALALFVPVAQMLQGLAS